MVGAVGLKRMVTVGAARGLPLSVWHSDLRYSRRSGVQDKKFVFCQHDGRWILQRVWRRRRQGLQSVPVKIKNEDGAHVRARRVQTASAGIDRQVLKAMWLAPFEN